MIFQLPQTCNRSDRAMADEKTIEKVAVSSPALSTEEVESQGFDEAATKKLLRRLDWHIIPFMSLIYLL